MEANIMFNGKPQPYYVVDVKEIITKSPNKSCDLEPEI